MYTQFFKMLADAVVIKAGKDLRRAYKNGNIKQIAKLTEFFLSDYFTNICQLEPSYILRKIREEQKEKGVKKNGC